MGKYDSANNCDLTVCIMVAEYRELIQDAEWRRNRISELETRVEALTQDNRRLMGTDDKSLGIADSAKRAFDGLVVE
jgi:hypothetical protein